MQALNTLKVATSVTIQLALLVPMAGCVHGTATTRAAFPLECGPEVTDEAIIRIAEDAIRAIGGDPTALHESHEVEIMEDGCDYILSAVPRGTEAVEGISMRITRDGQVTSFPWCCPLGSCPELCNPPPPAPEEPARPGSPRM